MVNIYLSLEIVSALGWGGMETETRLNDYSKSNELHNCRKRYGSVVPDYEHGLSEYHA